LVSSEAPTGVTSWVLPPAIVVTGAMFCDAGVGVGVGEGLVLGVGVGEGVVVGEGEGEGVGSV
jgi:hypothetical protein